MAEQKYIEFDGEVRYAKGSRRYPSPWDASTAKSSRITKQENASPEKHHVAHVLRSAICTKNAEQSLQSASPSKGLHKARDGECV
jgi:hypothetical protein